MGGVDSLRIISPPIGTNPRFLSERSLFTKAPAASTRRIFSPNFSMDLRTTLATSTRVKGEVIALIHPRSNASKRLVELSCYFSLEASRAGKTFVSGYHRFTFPSLPQQASPLRSLRRS